MFTGTAEELHDCQAPAREPASQTATLLNQIDTLGLVAGQLHTPAASSAAGPAGAGPSTTTDRTPQDGERSENPDDRQKALLVPSAAEDIAALGSGGQQSATAAHHRAAFCDLIPTDG
ncbi:hypothetical protein ACFU99_11130 [Streptomyces sp. NPDC057654]|uniref:hypothetical protein n=1 Tax=Streptomyces sp. NPDC057654 TaxID=3346196 RepID=UPI0036AA8750